MLKGRWFVSSLMQPSRRSTVSQSFDESYRSVIVRWGEYYFDIISLAEFFYYISHLTSSLVHSYGSGYPLYDNVLC